MLLENGKIEETQLVKIPHTRLVDEEASAGMLVKDGKTLFGTSLIKKIDEDKTQVGLWSLDLSQEGVPSQGASFKAFVTADNAEITSILPFASKQEAHLVIQAANSEQIYMIFDFESRSVKNVISLSSLPKTQFFSLLAVKDSQVRANLVQVNKGTDAAGRQQAGSIYQAVFEDFEEEEIGCDSSDYLFESMHIAFMQQEALRFEAELISSQNIVDSTESANGHSFE